MNQVCVKDTAYLVSRRSSEQKAGDKPSVIFCSGNRKRGERAKGAVPDKASDDSTYGCSKPFSQSILNIRSAETLILVNGVHAGPDRILNDGDRLAFVPAAEAANS